MRTPIEAGTPASKRMVANVASVKSNAFPSIVTSNDSRVRASSPGAKTPSQTPAGQSSPSTRHPVSDAVLIKLARALTAAGHPTTLSDIPTD